MRNSWRFGDRNLPVEQRSRTHWFDTTTFAVPSRVCFGNSGRDILRGPGFFDLDFLIMREFHIRERFRIQFRIKFRVSAMLGFKSCRNARAVLAGIELIQKLKKGQYGVPFSFGRSSRDI